MDQPVKAGATGSAAGAVEVDVEELGDVVVGVTVPMVVCTEERNVNVPPASA